MTVKTGAEEGDEAEVEPIRARDGLVAFDELLESMRTKTTSKRALWSVPLTITEDLVIGVKGSVSIRSERLVKPVEPQLMSPPTPTLQLRTSVRDQEAYSEVLLHRWDGGRSCRAVDRLV